MKFDRETYINKNLPIQYELLKLFSVNEPINIFEIGACEGEDSIRYSKLFPISSIFTFEPLPDNQKLIEDNFKKFSVDNARLFKFALSDIEGETDFYVSSVDDNFLGEHQNADWNFGNKSSSLLAPDKHSEEVDFIRFDQLIKVKTVTINNFCKSYGVDIIDIIHIDVQGAELMVLKGSAEYIRKIKVIWMEVSRIKYYKGQPLANDIEDFMKMNNFVLIKNTLKNKQGDHLYLSRLYFNRWRLFSMRYHFILRDFFLNAFNKVYFFLKSND